MFDTVAAWSRMPAAGWLALGIRPAIDLVRAGLQRLAAKPDTAAKEE